MTAGRSAPRYQMIASLYPQSKDLQSHLSEYFTVVVRLCHRLLKFPQKSTIGQIASSVSDSDLKAFLSELDLWSNTIKEDVSVLIAKRIEEEAQENFRFRALWKKSSESVPRQQRLETNKRVLESCSRYEYVTTWKQTRKAGNATLFSGNAEYQDWKSRTDSCTLVYTGKLGSGKSVLLANIVDDLNLSTRNRNIIVAYFFCRHDISDSLEARTVIGSLARQLLSPIPDLAMVAEWLDMNTSALDFEIILSLLQRALPPHYRAYFVLDGLDECDSLEREILTKQLGQVQKIFPLLLCISLRVEPNNDLELGLGHFAVAIIASIPDENPDIEAFIEAELERCIESRKLVIGEPTLILEIQNALEQRAQGMFLWVALQIQSLCAMETDQAIRDALTDLPKDLSETFTRILQRSEGLGKSHQRRILELVTAAGRPLTTEELREALSVVPGDTVWNPARLLNDICLTLTCCGCLLTVDEEELTIRFVHHSVEQFLLSDFNDSTSVPFTTDNAHRNMTDIIITYLSYGIFETQLSTMVVPHIMTGPVPSRIVRSALDSSSSVRSHALKLLQSRKLYNYDIGKSLAETSKMFNTRSVDEFYFHSYAKSYWLQHTLCTSEQEPVMYDLLLRLIKRNTINTNITDQDGPMLLWWAARNGHEAVVRLLLDSGKVDANSEDRGGHTILSRAAGNGHAAIVKLLLDSGKVDANSEDRDGYTMLSLAAKNGHEAVVRLLLDSGKVDANSEDRDGYTPLWWAAMNGHAAMVKLLLDSGKIDANSKSTGGYTPLSRAP
jgi:ankyrin repeat domain-containing protein 50